MDQACFGWSLNLPSVWRLKLLGFSSPFAPEKTAVSLLFLAGQRLLNAIDDRYPFCDS
jgi:hypothetical protein